MKEPKFNQTGKTNQNKTNKNRNLNQNYNYEFASDLGAHNITEREKQENKQAAEKYRNQNQTQNTAKTE